MKNVAFWIVKSSCVLMATLVVTIIAGRVYASDQCAACCKAASDGCQDFESCMSQQKCSGIEVGGWASAGIYSNAWGADNNALPMREQANGTFDQFWLYAEKKADNRGCGIALGGRVDFLFGADAQYARVGPSHSTLPMLDDFSDNGWDHQWTTSNDGVYGSALPQLYGELAVNDWTFRAGHFFSLVGYERIQATENFFYSRSYAFGIEPITHMGVLVSRKLSNRVEVTGGVTNGWDNGWINPSEAVTALGKVSVKLNPCTKFHYAVTFGDLQPGNQVYLHTIVLERQLSARWEYVLQSDFAVETGGAADVRQDYGMNQYLFYKLNDCWKLGARVEWLRAETYNTRQFGTDVFETRTGATFGLNYSPSRNLVIRPELRWDSANGRMANDFNNRRNTYQFSGGLDAIMRF